MPRKRLQDWTLALAPIAIAAAICILHVRAQAKEEALARYLQDHVSSGDIVILLLSDSAKIDLLPGMRVLQSEAVHWNDVYGYRVAWVVGRPDAEVPLLGKVTVRDIGPYRVHRLDLASNGGGGAVRGFDLVAHLPEAFVSRIGGGRAMGCPLRDGAFACPGEEWLAVSVRRVLMGGQPIECIYAHPADGSVLSITYPVTAGGKKVLLEGGIDDDGVYYPLGTRVKVEIETGAKIVGEALFENIPGINSSSIVLAQAIPDRVPVVLRISSEKQDTRHFCFRGFIE